MKKIDKMMVQKIEMLKWLRLNVEKRETDTYKAKLAIYQKHNNKLRELFNLNSCSSIKLIRNN